MKTYLLVTSFLNCAGTLLLGVSVIAAGRRNPRNLLLSLLLFSIALWSSFYWLWRVAISPERALLYCQLLMAAALFIPVTLTHFLARLTGRSRPVVIVAGYGLAVLFCIGDLAGYVVARVDLTEAYGWWPKAGPLFAAMLVFFAMWTSYSWWLAWQGVRHGDTPEARQLRYIVAAVVIGFIGGATNFPLWFDIPIPPVGNGLVLVYTAMLAHAIIKYRLPAVGIDLAKGVVYSCLSLTLATFYTMIQATAAYFVAEPLGSFELLRQFVGALLVSALFLWLAPRLLEQTLFKDRYRHRAQLRELSHRIFSIADEDRIFTESLAVIARALQVDHAALYFRGELQSGYACRAARGYGESDPAPSVLPEGHPLVLLLQSEKGTLVHQREEMPPGAAAAEVERLRSQFHFEALVPIHGHQTLLGFLLLGRPRRDGFFDDLDLSLVETIAVQIGLAVRSRQIERRSNQTEKLISLGTLAAGLAHELRNPLVSVKTFIALLRERGGDPEVQQEFMQVMDRDVNRIAAIIENVAAFAENQQVALGPVDLREVLRSVAEIAAEDRRRLAVELVWPGDRPGLVWGNFGQLVQVFLNLVQNALQAMEGRPVPHIRVLWRNESTDTGSWVRVEVEDNGRGIDPQILPRVFDPFVTTKATGGGVRRGMGLGLTIVKRIVDGHRGQIGVDSQPGAGTRFTLLLPVPEPSPA